MTKGFKTIAATLAIAGFMGMPVYAGESPSNTQEWAKEAGVAINEAMTYPRAAVFLNREGAASYTVTINRSGDVVNYHTANSSGTKSLDRASERALNKADFPAIPASYSGDELTFSLVMEYREASSPARRSYLNAKQRKEGSVTGTQIAILSGTSLASAR